MSGDFVRPLFDQPHEYLINLELEDQMVDFGQFHEAAQSSDGDRALHSLRDVGDAADVLRGLFSLRTERFRMLGQLPDAAVCRRGFVLDVRHQLRDVGGGTGGALGQLAHLVGDHGETAPGFSGAGSLDRCVEGQKIGLVGDFLD